MKETAEALIAQARTGDARATAKLLTLVENDEPGADEVMRVLYGEGATAELIGITGPPGSGKSTLVSELIAAYRGRHARIAVIAVDPSSPYTGGAILGDRIRMRERFLDEGVFIRSMASRGNAGGLARASARVARVLGALGAEVVLIETVGVGQEEVDVVRVADTVCVVSVPGLGDDVQAFKAGVLEIADVLVVNKSDLPGADQTARDLAQALSLGEQRRAWKPPIVRTSAAERSGLHELIEAIARHVAWSRDSGEWDRRRREAAYTEIEALLRQRLLRRIAQQVGRDALDAAAARVAAGEIDPGAAVDQLAPDLSG